MWKGISSQEGSRSPGHSVKVFINLIVVDDFCVFSLLIHLTL